VRSDGHDGRDGRDGRPAEPEQVARGAGGWSFLTAPSAGFSSLRPPF
jgi:hypothetical protein